MPDLTPQQTHILEQNLADWRRAFLQLLGMYRTFLGEHSEHDAVGGILAQIKGSKHSRDEIACVVIGAIRFVLGEADLAAATDRALLIDPVRLHALAETWDVEARHKLNESSLARALDPSPANTAAATRALAQAGSLAGCAGELRALAGEPA